MPRYRSLVLPLLVALAGGASTLASNPAPTRPPSRATKEPTLPVVAAMRLEGIDRRGGKTRARLIVSIVPVEPVRGLALHLVLPPGLRLPDGNGLPAAPLDLDRGAARTYVLKIEAPADRDRPIRLEASFRLEDGRSFTLGQGVTLRARERPQGRAHLGAWEVPAAAAGTPR